MEKWRRKDLTPPAIAALYIFFPAAVIMYFDLLLLKMLLHNS